MLEGVIRESIGERAKGRRDGFPLPFFWPRVGHFLSRFKDGGFSKSGE